MNETIRGRIEFHERYWKKPSAESKEFIKLLLQVDPAKRPTAAEAAQHPVSPPSHTRAESGSEDLETDDFPTSP